MSEDLIFSSESPTDDDILVVAGNAVDGTLESLTYGKTGPEGPEGPEGPPGPPGPAGPPGDTVGNYHHSQIVADTVWTVEHNLGYKPAGVVVTSSAGDPVEGGEVRYLDLNTLTITFAAPFGGTADLS